VKNGLDKKELTASMIKTIHTLYTNEGLTKEDLKDKTKLSAVLISKNLEVLRGKKFLKEEHSEKKTLIFLIYPKKKKGNPQE